MKNVVFLTILLVYFTALFAQDKAFYEKKFIWDNCPNKEQRITKKDIEENLLISGDVDLVIRTGGNYRLSNFLLWQTAYAEIYVTKTLWPDFKKRNLIKAIEWFNNVKRNFGK